MHFALYVGGIAALMFLSVLRPTLDKVAACAVAAILALYSGLRQGGFDYAEYQALIDIVREGPEQSLWEALFISKDPLFGIVVNLVGHISQAPILIFLTLGALAASTKLLYAISIERSATIFLGLYAVFLAPGLEFAAMRAGVAVGFLALATQCLLSRASRLVTFGLACISHISVIPGGVFISLPSRISWRRASIFVLTVTIGTFLVFSSTALEVFERAADYEYNRGTMLALVLPACTMGVLFFPVGLKRMRIVVREFPNVGKSFVVAVGFASMSLGSSLPMVTASTRFMEIAWFFALCFFVRTMRVRGSSRLWVGIGLFLLLLSMVNLYRSTWEEMIDLEMY